MKTFSKDKILRKLKRFFFGHFYTWTAVTLDFKVKAK